MLSQVPGYYEKIKRAMDLETISRKISSHKYHSRQVSGGSVILHYPHPPSILHPPSTTPSILLAPSSNFHTVHSPPNLLSVFQFPSQEFISDMELIYQNSLEFNGENSEFTVKAKILVDTVLYRCHRLVFCVIVTLTLQH